MEKTKTGNPFSQDYRVVLLSIAGLCGLIAGFLFLSFKEVIQAGKKSSFHEIGYNPRPIISQAINHLQDSLSLKITEEKKEFDSLTSSVGKDEEKNKIIKTNIQSIASRISNDSINNTILERFKQYFEDASGTDSLAFTKLNNVLHFDIDLKKLNKWQAQFEVVKDKWTDSVNFWLKIPDTKPFINYRGNGNIQD